jgi:galactokinase
VTTTWQAPGRVNLIGEHVDYNDGYVLPFALQFATTVRITPQSSGRVSVLSAGHGVSEFDPATQPGDVSDWAGYVAGVIWAMREVGVDMPGLDVVISSDVPVGAGLSSSAALTCAVAAALDAELGAGLDRIELATLARRSENDYVGVPTGSMDQLASMLCDQDHALFLDCRSLETRSIPFDPGAAGLELLLIDTLARHSLAGSEYGDRRDDCDRALELLGFVSWRDADLEAVDRLDDELLRRRARHVVSETQRVREVAAVLDAGRTADIGTFLSASHESLRDDFEVSCEELDVTVESALAAGALGSRMVGGGFGGCALALCRSDGADRILDAVGGAYASKGWGPPTVYRPRPSAGAHQVQ